LQTDQWTLQTVAEKADELGVDFRYDMGETEMALAPGEGARRRTGRPGADRRNDTAIRKKSLNSMQMLEYMQSLPPSEVANLQEKMANAGYYDQIGNGNYLPGDPLDDNTVRAFQTLMLEVGQTGQSMPVVLGKKLAEYRMGVRNQRMSQLEASDPNKIRSMANDYAQTVIGRDLTPDMEASLEQHLKSLVRDRAGYVAGSTRNSGDGPLPSEGPGFTEQDVKDTLDSRPSFKEDQRAMNTRALNFKLRNLMNK
jgi:hypothetical protein